MIKLFASSIDASAYLSGFGTAKGASICSINYITGEVVFSLVAEDDSVSGVVNGITVTSPTEDTVAAEIRAGIAAA